MPLTLSALLFANRSRAAVAIAIGGACGLASYASTFRTGYRDQDFRIFWLAAQIVVKGGNPYTQIVFTEGGPAFFYPITAAILVLPFAAFAVRIAGPLFIGLSCGALAFSVTERAWWPLLMFLSGSMLVSVLAAQWSPLLTLAFIVPGAMWLGAIKPNIGLAMLAFRPSARAALLMIAVTTLSLVVMPTWPREWLGAIRQSRVHFTPFLTPGGPLLLLALLRWRRPEARLLTAMAVLPSSPVVYEALPLFVIPANWREMLVLVVTTMAAYLFMRTVAGDTFAFMERGRAVVLWTCYAPALVMVLRRPNEGPTPAWIERAVARLPGWLRGTAAFAYAKHEAAVRAP